MNVRYDELQACTAAIEDWVEQLLQLKELPEHMLFRKWHLICMQEVCEVKLARYRFVTREFQWKIKGVEAFTLLQCYISMPCDDNSALRRFMAKLDQKKPNVRIQQLNHGNNIP
jgi:hypothetical protein